MSNKDKVITTRITSEQYAFISFWRQSKESELGMEITMETMLKRIIDVFIKQNNQDIETFCSPFLSNTLVSRKYQIVPKSHEEQVEFITDFQSKGDNK